MLEPHAVRATFFVVGAVAPELPERIRELAVAGHEIAHHGYTHRATHALDPAGERDEIERGISALGDCLGAAPAGYRSPAWELTPATLALLTEHRFAYDSSLMGDDRPYRPARPNWPSCPCTGRSTTSPTSRSNRSSRSGSARSAGARGDVAPPPTTTPSPKPVT